MSDTFLKTLVKIFHFAVTINCNVCSPEYRQFSRSEFVREQICSEPNLRHILRQKVCPPSDPFCFDCNSRTVSLAITKNHYDIFDLKTKKFSLLQTCSTPKLSTFQDKLQACYNESKNGKCFAKRIKRTVENFCPTISLHLYYESLRNSELFPDVSSAIFRCCRESLRKRKSQQPKEFHCRPHYDVKEFKLLVRFREFGHLKSKRTRLRLNIPTSCCGKIEYV